MVQESPKSLVVKFFGNTSESYEKIVNLTTFGKDSYWKEEILKRITKCNSVLDLACGTGLLTFKIATKFPLASITGVDITEGYLQIAKSKLKSNHKISFLLEDAEKINLDEKFDYIVSSYIPKYCVADILIPKCLSHLNPHGKIILHDFTWPKNKLVRFLWNLYFVLLQMFGFLVPPWKDVFKDLPKLIRSENWVDRYKDAMERKGLNVEIQYLTMGCSAILTGTKKV